MCRNIITFLFLAMLTFSSKAQNKTAMKLEAAEFSEKLKTIPTAQLVDVRTSGEFANGHLKDAMNIDWNGKDFEQKAALLDKEKPVFLYCMSGPRSTAASEKLKAMGFRNIYEMKGGMMKWRSENLPEVKMISSPGLNLSQYESLLKSDVPVLVDFYADWCAPCRKMEPYLSKMAKEMPDKMKLVRINADQNADLCKALNVSSLPVLKIYKKQQMVWDHLGFVTEDEVRERVLK